MTKRFGPRAAELAVATDAVGASRRSAPLNRRVVRRTHMEMPRRTSSWWWDAVEPLRAALHTRLPSLDRDRVLAYLPSWFSVQQELDRIPSREEYQKSTHLTSSRIGTYEQLFSKTFPNFETPSDIFYRLPKQLEGGNLASLFDGKSQ